MKIDRFVNADLKPRQREVEIPELAGVLFDEGENPVWIVRGLTAAELGRARQMAAEGRNNVAALVDALAGGSDKAANIRKAFGLGDDVPEMISLQIEMLTIASVSPKLGSEYRDVVVKLSEAFPTRFQQLVTAVSELTALGAELGKPRPSGTTAG